MTLLMRILCALLLLVLIVGQIVIAGNGAAKELTRQAGEVRENGKDGLKYVWIPAGTFSMGCSTGDSECSDDEKPLHRVTLTRGFWIGQTEVTVRAYKLYAKAIGKGMPPEPTIADKVLNAGWADERMPIVDVTWDEAQEYCRWTDGGCRQRPNGNTQLGQAMPRAVTGRSMRSPGTLTTAGRSGLTARSIGTTKRPIPFD